MSPVEAARTLERTIKNPRAPLTIADAATQSGLALRDAERGLHALTSTYRGHLRVTNDGDLVFLFPNGFTKPWETRDRLGRAFDATVRFLAGVGRFVVRAWLTIVLLAYVGIFLALLIGLTFARSSNDSRRSDFPGGSAIYVLFRVLGDALFWTFHPFSPFALGEPAWGTVRADRTIRRDQTPFYEKVNRFFFGPTPAHEDPREMERRLLAEIRAQKGRIGLGDVMRVTGLPREQADPLMAKLMLDYEGDVEVSEQGALTYKFESIRKTAEAQSTVARPKPAWERFKDLGPLTGNDPGTNFLIAALNGFNAVMAYFAMSHNLTVDNIGLLFQKVPMDKLPFDGTPIALGLVPFIFSLALFVVPVGRAAVRPLKQKWTMREKGRLAVVREVLARAAGKLPLTHDALVQAWKKATGRTPPERELTRVVVSLGGDVDMGENAGGVRYRFAELENEAEALEAERRAAPEGEARLGKVVFASDR